MVEAKQVEDGRVDIVDMDHVLDRLDTEHAGRAIDATSSDITFGRTHRETVVVVVEHPASLRDLDQCDERLVAILGEEAVVGIEEVAVVSLPEQVDLYAGFHVKRGNS